eukprot:COSAG02_NODE_51667_length_312_cov_1.450704_1_plen_37_part_10
MKMHFTDLRVMHCCVTTKTHTSGMQACVDLACARDPP